MIGTCDDKFTVCVTLASAAQSWTARLCERRPFGCGGRLVGEIDLRGNDFVVWVSRVESRGADIKASGTQSRLMQAERKNKTGEERL